jgi:hypothetical protein
MLCKVEVSTLEGILNDVRRRKDDDWRLISITCSEEKEGYDFLYHFDKNLHMEHLRLKVAKGQVLPSVSDIYFSAVVIENELQDFYDVKFEGLSIDYQAKFLIIGKNEIGLPCQEFMRSDQQGPENLDVNNSRAFSGGDANG